MGGEACRFARRRLVLYRGVVRRDAENKAEVRRKRDRIAGIAAATLSALLYGLSPAVAKLAYAGGSNGIMMTFTRSLFGLPVLFFLAHQRGVRLKPEKNEWIALVPVSLFGVFATTALLYSSFSYINVGMATVLHYVFPVLVMLAGFLFFRERLRWWKLVSLLLGLGGVLTFIPSSGQGQILGLLLALGSGFTYAGLMVAIERTAIAGMHVYKMAFHSSLIGCLASLGVGWATASLTLNLTAAAWVYSVLVSLMVSVGAFTLLNLAIVKCGATTTAIIAMLEPVTSVLFGALLLKEPVTPLNWAGFLLIMAGVFMVSFFTARAMRPGRKD